MAPLLEVRNLHAAFDRPGGKVYAVNGVDFAVEPGETLGIVGESGSGKSVSILSLLGLIGTNGRVTGGQALFEGRDLLALSKRELRALRGREIGVVFQDPMTSLNPIQRIGDQIAEAMLVHRLCSKEEAYKRTLALLEEVGIPDPKSRYRSYPHEFSGGMRQRVMIAIALACQPKLLIADEPTTALDVTVQMQVLAVLRKARERRRMSTIIITHDFGVATNFCDRIVVLYGGKVMESATAEQFIRHSVHPYSTGLKSSILEIGSKNRKLVPIPGQSAVAILPPSGCPFAPRCSKAIEPCRRDIPELTTVDMNHSVACHRAEEVINHVI
ncbi:ABC transporter ATP-binding protein [Paenibacillus humicola]|uniref:ABC transporter ATP-binding protein n=1 Tax=Paenibacillus humicola TaxID=3110540 RepID=UPI00237ADD79|nr:ABC transporter ATP-binding protein [Paenibacillus humicola]